MHFDWNDSQVVLDAIQEVSRSIQAEVQFKQQGLPPENVEGLFIATNPLISRWVDLHVAEHSWETRNGSVGTSFSVLEIDFWSRSQNPLRVGSYMESPRPNDVVTILRDETFTSTYLNSNPSPTGLGEGDSAKDLYTRDFPIDVVYTWVDGSDPDWKANKSRFEAISSTDGAEGRAHHEERFRDRNELKYSLRSLEMFAPFIRNVYVVTMGQVPPWLDTTNSRLKVVSHRDIYSRAEALPTFNSSSIETQLHHIDGLAEHFIYFNDDMFLGRPCSWADFFQSNGAFKFFPAGHSTAFEQVEDDAEEYLIADRNAVRLLSNDLGVVTHKSMDHAPYPARRSTLYAMESIFASQWHACEMAKFRSPADLRPIAFMAPHFSYLRGQSVVGKISHRYIALWKPSLAVQLQNLLAGRRYKTFCINDAGVQAGTEATVSELVANFLRDYYPYKSSFEK